MIVQRLLLLLMFVREQAALIPLSKGRTVSTGFESFSFIPRHTTTELFFDGKAIFRDRFVGSTRLYLSSTGGGFPWEAPVPSQGGEEETLLRVHLSVNDGVDKDEALAKVQKYTQSFPFSAVLPVQPLQYIPTPEGGVDLTFLRKKTKEKGSVDGGLVFLVQWDETQEGIDVVVKRNSKGQNISKMFSEKLVVQAYVRGIGGENNEKTGVAPTDFVSMESVFHKWLGPNF